MRTVSFQGTQLSASQRRQLDAQKRAASAPKTFDLLKVVDRELSASQSASSIPDDYYKFRVVFASKGTPWLGDAFGY